MSGSQSSCRSASSAADAAAEALRNTSEPWLPGLARQLVARSPAWTSFDCGRGYGTARWLSGEVGDRRDTVAEIAIGTGRILVEVLPQEALGRFAHLDPAQFVGPAELSLIRDAAAILTDVPALAQAVGEVVRTLHVLRAPEGYDVSHSEPTIPCSVFVSVPALGEKDAALRLAESIVHEAMHLQLTFIESVLPIVRADGMGFSPWQQRERPIGGLMHGLYVFSVIARFMDHVSCTHPELATKARRRRREIEEEVASLEDLTSYLTTDGVLLYAKCMDAMNSPAPEVH